MNPSSSRGKPRSLVAQRTLSMKGFLGRFGHNRTDLTRSWQTRYRPGIARSICMRGRPKGRNPHRGAIAPDVGVSATPTCRACSTTDASCRIIRRRKVCALQGERRFVAAAHQRRSCGGGHYSQAERPRAIGIEERNSMTAVTPAWARGNGQVVGSRRSVSAIPCLGDAFNPLCRRSPWAMRKL